MALKALIICFLFVIPYVQGECLTCADLSAREANGSCMENIYESCGTYDNGCERCCYHGRPKCGHLWRGQYSINEKCVDEPQGKRCCRIDNDKVICEIYE